MSNIFQARFQVECWLAYLRNHLNFQLHEQMSVFWICLTLLKMQVARWHHWLSFGQRWALPERCSISSLFPKLWSSSMRKARLRWTINLKIHIFSKNYVWSPILKNYNNIDVTGVCVIFTCNRKHTRSFLSSQAKPSQLWNSRGERDLKIAVFVSNLLFSCRSQISPGAFSFSTAPSSQEPCHLMYF